MRKIILIIGCLLIMTAVSSAQEPTFGIGVNGGLIYPILQEDQGTGSVFGVKVIYGLMNMITVEPHISFIKYGNPDFTDYPSLFNGFEGSKVTSYGVDAVLGSSFGAAGINPYLFAGIGFYNAKRDITAQDQTDLSWTGGLGVEIGVGTNFSIDARGKLYVVPLDGGGSKKAVTTTVGVNMFFGGK